MVGDAWFGGRVVRHFIADTANRERAAVSLHLVRHEPRYPITEVERIIDIEYVEVLALERRYGGGDILQTLLALLRHNNRLFKHGSLRLGSGGGEENGCSESRMEAAASDCLVVA